jgi:hypothetical protein
MQRKNLCFGAAAVLVAAGAIGAGVMVSSNAMAASGEVGDQALTISLVNVGANGDAFQCTFDAASVPGIATAPVPLTPAEGGVHVTGVAGDSSGLPGVVSGSGVIVSATDGSLPSLVPLTPSEGAKGGIIAVTGAADADGTASVTQIGADGSLTPIEIREGTASECAAAQKGLPPANATIGAGTITNGTITNGTITNGTITSDTVVDPKG